MEEEEEEEEDDDDDDDDDAYQIHTDCGRLPTLFQ